MFYFGYIKNDNFAFLAEGDTRITKDFVEITDEQHQQLLEDNSQGMDIVLYGNKVFTAPHRQYIQDGDHFIINENYEQEQAEKEEQLFNQSFFNTSLGYVRRKVTMADGTIRDFLSDILALLEINTPIITYNRDLTQNKVLATKEFINECKQQMLVDFYGE